jgi:predicted Zn-dependent protease
MLLERGMTKEALAAFEATMAKEPNRFNGLAGAAQAAELLGDKAKAKAHYARLVALAGDSGADRRELAAAREFLAKN